LDGHIAEIDLGLFATSARTYLENTCLFIFLYSVSCCSDDDITAGSLFFLRALDDDTYTPSMSVMISCSWKVPQYDCGWEGLYDYDLHMPLPMGLFNGNYEFHSGLERDGDGDVESLNVDM